MICISFIKITLKTKCHSNSKLLLSGTDILMYEIKTEGVSEDFCKHKEIFGFNNYLAKSNKNIII